MSFRRTVAVLIASAAIVVLAGCGQAADPAASPSPTSTRSATPSPEPTVEPETRPALGELVLTTGGLGPLELGTDPATLNPETAVVELLPDSACEGEEAQRWSAAYPERPLGNELRAFEVGRLLSGERIETIQVFDPLIKTATGLAPRMALDELKASYPDAQVIVSGAGRDQYLLEQDSFGVLVADVWQEGTENAGLVSSLSIGLVAVPSYHPVGSCALS